VRALPTEGRICPDFGLAQSTTSADRGYVDFFINGNHKIGVELTRDGLKLEQHVARFSVHGIYAPLKLRSWVVVDFRQSATRKSTVEDHPHCIFVVFDDNFATATIKQAGTVDEVFHLQS
jgi:hypothetical protein